MDECLGKYGISVERPVTATSITQDDSGVTTTLELPDGKTETLRSKYVVGCDGAHSAVRHASTQITFPGAPYPQDFILCDLHLRDSDIPHDRFALYMNNKGVLGILPMNGELTRVIASRSTVPVKGQEVPTLDQLQAHFTSLTSPSTGTLEDPVWLTRFRLHHRCASQYRDGRLFVAGDAAHIHSPAGGQGMNAGIQDSINLGWKLAHALCLQSQPSSSLSPSPSNQHLSAAADALLDTYDLERRPVGMALLRRTDRLFLYITAPSPWFVPYRNFVLRYVMPWAARSRGRRRRAFHFLSQFGVDYRGRSRIVGDAMGGFWSWRGGGGGVRGGDRLPDGKVWDVLRGGETSLQRVCVGAPHHLVLFAGGAGREGDLHVAAELETAAERALAACKTEVRVHYISGEGRTVEREDWYADRKGELHAKFGFAKRPGYVLVRPDGYVAHIGLLAKLDRFVAFLDGYLVSPLVTPPRSLVKFVSPLVWAAAGAGLALKLWRLIARRV